MVAMDEDRNGEWSRDGGREERKFGTWGRKAYVRIDRHRENEILKPL